MKVQTGLSFTKCIRSHLYLSTEAMSSYENTDSLVLIITVQCTYV